MLQNQRRRPSAALITNAVSDLQTERFKEKYFYLNSVSKPNKNLEQDHKVTDERSYLIHS